MGLKKIAPFIAIAAVIVLGFNLLRSQKPKVPVLRVYTWSNYLPDEVLKKFTEKTGIKVELSYLSSNEEMFAKLRAGASGFDVIQPSDYMMRQLIRLNMLRPLEKEALPNLVHLDPAYQDPSYDPGQRFSVPFTWGTTGIAVNTEKVKVPEGKLSWKFLLNSPDPKHTSVLDDMREVFGAVLSNSGESINTKDVATLEKARGKIIALKNNILMFNSEPKALLLKGELNVAHIFSCDAAQATAANPKIKYYIPEEGGTLWTDNFAIPSTAQHVAEAHQFINFILDPVVAAEIVSDKKLATPNLSARKLLNDLDKNDPSVYPDPKDLMRMKFLDDLGDTLPVVSRMWTEVKS